MFTLYSFQLVADETLPLTPCYILHLVYYLYVVYIMLLSEDYRSVKAQSYEYPTSHRECSKRFT